MLLARVGTQVGLAAFTVLVARTLGSARFGEYAFIASVIVVGNVLTTFGTDMLLIREIAASEDLSRLPGALLIQLALSAIFIAGVFGASMLLPSADVTAMVALRIYSLAMVPLAFYTVFTTALRGWQDMAAYAIVNVALMLMQVLASVWLLLQKGNLIQLAELLLLAQTVATVLAGALCLRRIPNFPSSAAMDIQGIMPLLKASAPIALLGILGISYQRLNFILLPALAGSTATGLFSAAARLVEAAKVGHLAAFTALYPSMAQVHSEARPQWTAKFRIPGAILLGTALIASLSISLLAQPLIGLLFGAQYLSSVPAARILAWILVPYTLNSFLTLALLAHGEEHAIAVALAASLGMLAALAFWWTPLAGIQGAAWAALCAEGTQSVALLLLDWQRGQIAATLTGLVEPKAEA